MHLGWAGGHQMRRGGRVCPARRALGPLPARAPSRSLGIPLSALCKPFGEARHSNTNLTLLPRPRMPPILYAPHHHITAANNGPDSYVRISINGRYEQYCLYAVDILYAAAAFIKVEALSCGGSAFLLCPMNTWSSHAP